MSGISRDVLNEIKSAAGEAITKAENAQERIANVETWIATLSGVSWHRRLRWLLTGK